MHCRRSCNARQVFSLTTGLCCLQLANLERRAAKGGEPGASASAARAYYRAAVEQLAAAGGSSLVSVDASLASVDDAVGAAAAAALPERVSSLTRALDSWAQMEFKLGCGWQLWRLFVFALSRGHTSSSCNPCAPNVTILFGVSSVISRTI